MYVYENSITILCKYTYFFILILYAIILTFFFAYLIAYCLLSRHLKVWTLFLKEMSWIAFFKHKREHSF